jgi:hypothetical protein
VLRVAYGNPTDATRQLEEALELRGDRQDIARSLAGALAVAGNVARAKEVREEHGL